MTDWRHVLGQIATDAEHAFDRLKQRLDAQLGHEPIQIVPYHSYGSANRVVLRGRVLEDRGDLSAHDNDSVWNNLADMYRRFASDEIAGARVRVRFNGMEQEAVTDEEGHLVVDLALAPPLESALAWHLAEAELLAPTSPTGAVTAQINVMVPPPGAHFGVISDIDDTVLQTGATNLVQMARTVFLGNARTRLPFPGVAALYQALYNGAPGAFVNPIFYVSSGPWNIYDMVTEFFALQGIPKGPMFLRDWGLSSEELTANHHHVHKLAAISEIMSTFPDLPFLLIGDSGQQDPEIYSEVVRRFPGRVLAIYIRSVDLHESRIAAVQRLAEEVAAVGSTLVLADDTVAAARHAASQGWITAEALSAVEGGKEADMAAPTDEVQTAPPPAVVLDTAEVAAGAVATTLSEHEADPAHTPPVIVQGNDGGDERPNESPVTE